MAKADDIARDEAVAWRVRLSAADDAQWDAFAAWLESSPVNRAAYERVAALDADLEDALSTARAEPREVPPTAPAARRWGLYAALSGVVAVGALCFLVYPVPFQARTLVAIDTRPGARQAVALGNGSTAFLNGGTRILIDRKDRRFVRVERGEVAFSVAHDADRPFTVEVNGDTVLDLGTVFNIATSPEGYRLAVAEGAVVLNPAAENVKLTRGGRLFVPTGNAPISVGSQEASSIASWRRRELIYDQEPLSRVALDLSRGLGTRIDVAPAVASQSFTGVIRIIPDQTLLFAGLQPLLAVKASRSDDGWKLEPADRAAEPSGPVRSRR